MENKTKKYEVGQLDDGTWVVFTEDGSHAAFECRELAELALDDIAYDENTADEFSWE